MQRYTRLAALMGLMVAGCAESPSGQLASDSAGGPSDLMATSALGSAALDGPDTVVIRNDKGGTILDYAMRKASWQASGMQVRFAGDCASACTLYLGLPPEQLCLEPSARFRFHLPRAPNAGAAKGATSYLVSAYPDWVVDWIARHGGLKPDFIVMGYDTAARHIPACTASRTAGAPPPGGRAG